jgi:cell fate regulator YaaT (PSP1 superfamily)
MFNFHLLIFQTVSLLNPHHWLLIQMQKIVYIRYKLMCVFHIECYIEMTHNYYHSQKTLLQCGFVQRGFDYTRSDVHGMAAYEKYNYF